MSEPILEFSPGQIVALRFSPSVHGAVIQVFPGVPENRYSVFHDGKAATYYASQLQEVVSTPPAPALVSLQRFNAQLTALQLTHPSISSLFSLHAARVDFIPYQFRPVLKFINADRPRLLIADEVGVGKTIEAGLILREFQARRDVRSVLVICPKSLVTERKWQMELRRFDEDFDHLDGAKLRHCLTESDMEGVWPDRYAKSILPFSLFDERLLHGERQGRRKVPGLLELDPPPKFDLVIVDEAHAIRNASTWVHQGVRFFCDHAEAVVFLTATPIQLSGFDLFTLLNVLRPDLVIDPVSFEHLTEPNPHINAASTAARGAKAGWQDQAREELERAAATSWGRQFLQPNPEYERVSRMLTAGELTRQQRVGFVRDVERLHTLDRLINRTRRRDIGQFTTRKPETIAVPFTPEQQALHDSLLNAQARILRRLHGDRGVQFMLSTLRRQAASSIFGLAPLIREILTRRISELEWDEMGASDDLDPSAAVESLSEEIAGVLAMAESLSGLDPKLDALHQVIRDKQVLPNNKLLLFSSFRHTLRYLEASLGIDGVRIGLIHGGTGDDERRELRYKFSLPRHDQRALDILLSSEVGSEGLDYQFCDALINYDLPWNPMRVEQRIGRIDRYRQKSEAVVIYNFVTPGTVDADIYFRCLLRIGIFQAALGGSEEILGRISQGLRRIGEDFELSEEERQARLQQLADNEVRVLQEQTRVEEQQAAFFGISLPLQLIEQEVQDATSAWLSPNALRNLVQTYLGGLGGGEATLLGAGPRQTLRASQADRSRLLEDFRQLPARRALIDRAWERWLKGADPHLPVTFDSEYARDEREVMFITPVHPLAQQAARSVQSEETPYVALRVHGMTLPAGEYPFAIYQWESKGVRTTSSLQPVCTSKEVQDRFFELVGEATSVNGEEVSWPEQAVFDDLEAEQYRLWSGHREDYRTESVRLVSYRRESLRQSHAARVRVLRDQLEKANHANLKRMRQAQIDAAEADHARRTAELDEAEAVADVISRPVAYGYLLLGQEN
jgi:ATP-dependent helicase HepA